MTTTEHPSRRLSHLIPQLKSLQTIECTQASCLNYDEEEIQDSVRTSVLKKFRASLATTITLVTFLVTKTSQCSSVLKQPLNSMLQLFLQLFWCREIFICNYKDGHRKICDKTDSHRVLFFNISASIVRRGRCKGMVTLAWAVVSACVCNGRSILPARGCVHRKKMRRREVELSLGLSERQEQNFTNLAETGYSELSL